LTEEERLRQSLPADAGRGDLLKTIIDRVELVDAADRFDCQRGFAQGGDFEKGGAGRGSSTPPR
jgi:hypothetical protein